MVDKTDDLLISISTDTTTIKRQLKQLGDSISQTTSGIQKQFDGLGKGIDASLTPMQKRINDMVGLPVGPKLKEWRGALADAGNQLDKTGHAAGTTNTSLQAMFHSVRSIGEQLALGVSPAQALTGQLSHLSYVATQPGGITGALKAIGTMAGGLITKFPYVTAAVAAAGVAFLAYEAMGGSHLKTLDEITKTHEANIKLLGDAWDGAAAKKKNYAALSVNSVNASNSKDAQDAKDLLATQIKSIFDQVYQTIGAGGGAQGPLQKVLKSQFEPFKQALADLANTSDVKTFIDKIDSIAEVNPKLSAARDVLKGLAMDAANTAAAIPGLAEKASAIGDAFSDFNRALAGVDSKPVQKELQDVFDKAAEGQEPIEAIRLELAKLEQANPSFAGILAGFQSILDAAAKTDAALDGLGAKFFANQGTPTNGRQKLPVGLLPDSVDVLPEHMNKEDLGAAYDKAIEKAARKNRFHAPKITADDQFANDLQAIRDRTTALNEEMASLGLSYEAQQKRKTALDLEQQALKQVREEARKKGDADWQNAQLTPDQIAKIDAVSEAYARQADALKKAQEMQQLQQDMLKGAFDDLRSALDDGKLDWQDFAKIAMNALDKIIDKIENDLVDAIMQASGPGGGSFGSILGFLTGSGGGSSNVFPGGGVLNSLGGLYDTGGYTGPGGKKDIAGLVHKGEVVFSQDDISRLGGVGAVEAMRRGKVLSAPSMPRLQSPANSNGGGYQDNRVISIDARGAQQGVGEEIKKALAEYDKASVPRTVKALSEAKRRGMM